jgi:hypothetical protein
MLMKNMWIASSKLSQHTLITFQLRVLARECSHKAVSYNTFPVPSTLSLYLSIYLSIYFYGSHLEYRVSLKHFVSLQFLNLRQTVGLLGRGISLTQGRYLRRTTPTQNKRRKTYMYWVGVEHMIPVFEDISCLRPLGHGDRLHYK